MDLGEDREQYLAMSKEKPNSSTLCHPKRSQSIGFTSAKWNGHPIRIA